jgi:hypothetical protein
MTKLEVEKIITELYKLDHNKSKMPICEPWCARNGYGPRELYIPMSVVVEAMEIAGSNLNK